MLGQNYSSEQEKTLTALEKAKGGLLFIDGDASVFVRPDSCFNGEELRFKLSALMADLPGTYVLVIAEHDSRTHRLTQSLRSTGLSDFSHMYYFEDYTPEKLFQILGQCLTRKRLSLSAEAAVHLSACLHKLCARRELGYANARTMKPRADVCCWKMYRDLCGKIFQQNHVSGLNRLVYNPLFYLDRLFICENLF